MKKKGFTLVELLAVIVILAVILLVGVPTIIDNINRQKEIATNKVYDLIKCAAKNYEIDYGVTEKQAIHISDLCERYIACPIINPSTNEEIRGYISIADGEYKILKEVKFDWNLNGGTTSQEFQHNYISTTDITLIDPTKPNSDFKEWVVVRGNSTINNKILTIGDTDTEIWAMWTNWAKLTIDPNGGTTSQSLESFHRSGTTIELEIPTREGYAFTGWTISNDNSIVSGNNFTMGSEDIVITANWKLKVLNVTFSKNDGSSSTLSQTFIYGESGNKFGYNTDGTAKWGTSGQFGTWDREGYILLGWSRTSTATVSDYGIYSNVSDSWIDSSYPNITLYAVWQSLSLITEYSCANGSVGSNYKFTYTGNCEVIDDGNNNWRIKFLTDGTFKSSMDALIDVFLVGGGGGGGNYHRSSYRDASGAGGGGGYTTTERKVALLKNKEYNIVVGAGGGNTKAGNATTAFDLTANGGNPGGSGTKETSAPVGGTGGNNGANGVLWGGGNGPSGSSGALETREFGEADGELYSGGGGGGLSYYWDSGVNGTHGGTGGAGGGGHGVDAKTTSSDWNGKPNTGGGGGGGGATKDATINSGNGGSGGSGIVVIRNNRNLENDYIEAFGFRFRYTGDCEVIDDGNGNWRIKFLTSGIFMTNSSMNIDAFLVGGGGGGGNYHRSDYRDASGAGGGGGYTTTEREVAIIENKEYNIVVGAGGGNTKAGNATTAFDLTANGGNPGGSGTKETSAPVGGTGGNNGANGVLWGGGNGPSGSSGALETREFGEADGELYSGGGGGGLSYYWDSGANGTDGGTGGAGGGGHGVDAKTTSSDWNGKANTGGGGGGGGATKDDTINSGNGGAGGSGIVVIRNAR